MIPYPFMFGVGFGSTKRPGTIEQKLPSGDGENGIIVDME